MTLRAVPVMALLLFAAACVRHPGPVASARTDRTPLPPAPPATESKPTAVMRSSVAPTAAEPARTTPDEKTLARIDELLARIQDAYFDYDRHILRADAEQALRGDASTLAEIVRRYPDFRLVVEGHCDERGSDEYNLGLGDARAQRAKEYLVGLEIGRAHV